MSATIPEITDATFEREVLGASDTVLVKFWADWCPPCRALSPVLEQIAAQGHPDFRILSINSDENPETAMRYQVIALPIMKVFRGGEVVKTIIGAKPVPALTAELAPYLA
ncbi:MAG: thioredoxin domain-containing protein [Rhodoglobus sp.]